MFKGSHTALITPFKNNEIDEKSFRIAKNAGVIFVMNECPKKILEN